MSNGTRRSIVLAEDNPGDVFLVREALLAAGLDFDLTTIEDGEEVLRYFENVDGGSRPLPDLLLLDLNMPKCSGDEILQQLRAMPATASLPVVVLTSSAHPKDREVATALGVEQYFTKPADYEAFLKVGEIVRDTLRRE